MFGEIVTVWAIRLALVGYFTGLAALLLSHGRPRWQRSARWVWILGCLLYLAHFASAFQFYHGWSHQSAMLETARQAREVVGVSAGYGIYLNYLFTILWTCDSVWWLMKGDGYFRRPKLISAAIHSYLFFIVVNGTVVFEEGAIRWLSVVALFSLTILWVGNIIVKARSIELRSPQA